MMKKVRLGFKLNFYKLRKKIRRTYPLATFTVLIHLALSAIVQPGFCFLMLHDFTALRDVPAVATSDIVEGFRKHEMALLFHPYYFKTGVLSIITLFTVVHHGLVGPTWTTYAERNA